VLVVIGSKGTKKVVHGSCTYTMIAGKANRSLDIGPKCSLCGHEEHDVVIVLMITMRRMTFICFA